MNTTGVEKPNKKVVPPPTKKELQELEHDYIVQCTKIPQSYKNKGATYLLRCNLCEQYLEIVLGAKGHIQGKRHIEKKILKKVEEKLKLVGSPNEEQFDAITVKLQQVYDEWSAEACGQQTVREKIVSDFEEFVQSIKGCENVVVELFGSTYTGFALKDSDINMNLRFRDHPINSSSYHTVVSAVVERLTTMVDNGGDDMVYTDFKNNLYSSVSHISFTHQPSGLCCHVRYGSYHGAPICTGKLLQCYGAVDHRVKVLAVVLKYWAKLCRLDIQELGSYPSQMFVLMLVHFLQHRSPPLLPVPPKPNGFNDSSLQRQEHFNEYLSGLDHMIKMWKVTSNESLGVLWVDMLRFYYKEETFGNKVVQVTENDLLKKDTSWSTYKLPVVLSPASPRNMAKACSSRKMYLYLEACFKNTLVYFGRACLDKPSTMLPTEDHSKSQGAGSCDLYNTEENTSTTAKSSSHVTYLTDVASQLSDFDDSDRSYDLDFDVSHDLDHDDHASTSEVEISCEQHNSTHLEDSVEVNNDVTNCNGVDNKELQYDFVSSNFATKKLPDVCSLCKQEGHTFTSRNCPSHKKVEKNMLTCHPPLASRHLQELDEVFIDLKEKICLQPQDRMLREDICSIIERHVKDIYPDAELVLFGSSANEFGSPNSDIDISMKLPGNFEHDDNAKIIERVAHHLKTTPQQGCNWLVDAIQAITTARVPLVKMTLTKKWNGLECDISLGNHLALHNTELLASYASIDERVQVMGYVLKEFAKSSDMCDASSGSLSSYAYILLLLHYLQQVKPPVIPVLQQIGEGDSVIVDGWNCWFYRFSDLSQLKKLWPHIGENKRTIGELLIDFFKYYLREFDWQRHVLCIRQLEPLSKLEKEWATKQVCIEDPFNHDHNLSNHLTNKMWSYICNAFKCAHNHISNPQLYNQPVTIITVLSVGFYKNVPQDGLCYICRKRGHGSYNCPNQKVCDLCGKEGHVDFQCPLNWRGHSPRHSGPFLPHPRTSRSSHTQLPYQSYVMPQAASRNPVHQPSDAPNHGPTKKMTNFTQRTKPVSVTTTRPFTSSSQPRGRSSSSNAASHKSQNTKPVRDTAGSTASDSSRRIYYQQQGGNRGRKSRTKSGSYHHGTKQRHQQDNYK